MIEPSWKRIAGIHIKKNGEIAAVWLALDGSTDVVHVYDACVFKREVPVVIAEGLNARGRWIPIAWQNADFSKLLEERGCRMMREPSDENDSIAELVTRDILERMRTHRFKVSARLKDWIEEYQTFNKVEGAVPRDTHPLMAATRHAMAQIRYAKGESKPTMNQINYPKLAIR